MKKKKNNPFSGLQNAAVGIGGLGITTGVVAGISAKAPAGTPNLSQGMNTLAGFTPVVATGVGGMSALKAIKGLKKPRKKK